MKKLLLAFALMAAFLPAFAERVQIGDLYYNLNDEDKTAEVTYEDEEYAAFSNYSSLSGDLVIPETVEYSGSVYTVTTIGDYAFFGCSGCSGSLTIPNSVTTIGTSAFYFCTGLTGTLTIPNSVTTIRGSAFEHCTGFTGSLIIPNSVTTIGGGAFAECARFTGSLTIGDSVTEIGAVAFKYCGGFTSIELGKSLEKIGKTGGSVFEWCDKVESIVCHAVNPPVFYGSYNFDSNVLKNADLFVPAESVGLYAKAEVWKDFTWRYEMTDPEDPIEPVFESLYMGIDESLDLSKYLADMPSDGCVVSSQYSNVADVIDGNVVQARQFGQTTVTYKLYDAPIATFDIYVCPTVTIEHGEGAVYSHFVLYNTRPTIYLEPADGYKISGVTHNGEDVTDFVVDNKGHYTFANPVTENTVINLSMEDDGTAGDFPFPAEASDVRVLVSGHNVSVAGLAPGETTAVYELNGTMVLSTTDNPFTVERSGIFLLRAADRSFKIIIR